MPAYHRFGPSDIFDDVLTFYPHYDLVSGSEGWRGGIEGSGSAYLYAGVCRSGIVGKISYQSTLGSEGFEDPYRKQPLTASISVVRVTPDELEPNQLSRARWGEEHWDVLMGLYDYYSNIDPDYTTASYDYYCLYFNKDSQNIAASPFSTFDSHTGRNSVAISASFTIESWIKPFLTASVGHDFTIMSSTSRFWLGLTGSQGKLCFSSSQGVFTSSFGPANQRWSHVSVASDGTNGSFTVNLNDAGTFPCSSDLPPAPNYTSSLCIGAVFGSAPLFNIEQPVGSVGKLDRSFHGFIGESRFWNSRRTFFQLSSSFDSRLVAPFDPSLVFCYAMNEGPLGFYPDSSGSGSFNADKFDLSTQDGRVREQLIDLFLSSFEDRLGPVWHPNDNTRFIVPKNLVGQTVTELTVLNIPSAFYGKQIATGSVSINCLAYSSPEYGLLRRLVDDGRGGLYMSGSACSSSIQSTESYAGVGWNKVGNVFYTEGLIVIKDPSLLQFGGNSAQTSPADTDNILQLEFDGVSRVPVKTLNCRLGTGEANCSTNRTFSYRDPDGVLMKRHPSGSTYITSVGLYDADKNLVGIAKLAQPIKKRDKQPLNVKLRFDF